MDTKEILKKGELLVEQGKLSDAEEQFLLVIQYDHENKEASNNLGFIAYKQGDLEKAVLCFLQALEKDSSYKDALENLVSIFSTSKGLPLLIRHLEKIAAKTDQKSDAALNITKLLLNNILSISHEAKEIRLPATIVKEINYETGKAPLKILYLADCRSQHTRRFAKYFAERGHDVHIFDAAKHDSFGLEGITLHSPPAKTYAGNSDAGIQLLDIVCALNNVIKKINPDIVHGHYVTGWCWWGAMCGFRPFVITSWGSDIFLDVKNVFTRRFNAFCLRESMLLMADSMDLLEATAELRGKRDGIHYVPFGINTDFFRPGEDTSLLAQRLGIQGRRVVLSPRQFKPQANIHVLIEAIPRIVEKIPDAVFILKTYLTQDSDYEKSLHALVIEKGLEERVIFLQEIDYLEMPILYNLADVMITLRDTDGSSCSMLESMACKTPVVASNIESMREWIQDGENGKLVNQHDPHAISEAVIEILSKSDLRQKMTENGFSLVREKADYRKNWADVEILYYELREDRGAKVKYYSFSGNGQNLDIETGWNLIDAGELKEARMIFLKAIGSGLVPVQIYLKSLLGIAKAEWLQGNIGEARKLYINFLKIVTNFEADSRLNITLS